MAEPVVDRKTLRRAIAKDLKMPFFRRFPDGIIADASSDLSTAFFQDIRLKQRRDFWNNMWLYNVDSGESRRIIDFLQPSNRLMPEFNFTTTPTTAHTYEIFSIHTPDEIHDAINDALREGFPSFFDVTVSEDIVLESNKIEYDLVGNTNGRGNLVNPFRIKNIEIERTSSGSQHHATAGSVSTITDDQVSFTAIDTGWRVSLYEGLGSGQTQKVASGDASGVLTPAANWTTTPDTTTKFRVWQDSKQTLPWQDVTAINFDLKDNPGKMYFRENMSSLVGMRLRVRYVAAPQSLSNDTAETVVPQKYIVTFAKAKLFAQRAEDVRHNTGKFLQLVSNMELRAEKFRVDHAFDLPDQTWWTEEDYGSDRGFFFGQDDGNPLGWGG